MRFAGQSRRPGGLRRPVVGFEFRRRNHNRQRLVPRIALELGAVQVQRQEACRAACQARRPARANGIAISRISPRLGQQARRRHAGPEARRIAALPCSAATRPPADDHARTRMSGGVMKVTHTSAVPTSRSPARRRKSTRSSSRSVSNPNSSSGDQSLAAVASGAWSQPAPPSWSSPAPSHSK